MAEKLDYRRKLEIVEGAAKEALLNVKKEYDLHLKYHGKKPGESITGLLEAPERYQYGNCIFGYDIVFEEEYGLPKVEEYNDTIIQLYIAPYRIYKEDVESAIKKAEKNDKHYPFKEKSKCADYDTSSGNFHKKPDDNGNFEYQIVLIAEGTHPQGPGFRPEFNDLEFQKNQSFEYRKDFIKTKYYFPRIDDEKKDYSIEELLRQALDYIGISKRDEDQ